MYSPLPASATNFQMIRKGWFHGNFELTDGKLVYGELDYPFFFTKKASVKTASAVWIFEHNFFGRTIFITDEKGLPVGELRLKLFGLEVKLNLANGNVFSFARPMFWKRQYFFWLNEQQEKVLSIKPEFFSRKMDIVLEENLHSDSLLLIFLGTHLVKLSRRKRVAAAH